MKLPQNYFTNLSAERYKAYLKLLPNMQQENTKIITMLIMTFIAISVFGVFAINPTLTTIFQLNKELADTQFTHKQLTEKISNLSILQQKYSLLGTDITYVDDAIPHTPEAPILMAQLQELASETHVTIISSHIASIQLASPKPVTGDAIASYIFSMQAQGSYENMMQFANELTQINRLITVESMSINRDATNNKLLLDIRGRQYFKP